jgi:hypothetical protein
MSRVIDLLKLQLAKEELRQQENLVTLERQEREIAG